VLPGGVIPAPQLKLSPLYWKGRSRQFAGQAK
jgi:hypothetical protein